MITSNTRNRDEVRIDEPPVDEVPRLRPIRSVTNIPHHVEPVAEEDHSQDDRRMELQVHLQIPATHRLVIIQSQLPTQIHQPNHHAPPPSQHPTLSIHATSQPTRRGRFANLPYQPNHQHHLFTAATPLNHRRRNAPHRTSDHPLSQARSAERVRVRARGGEGHEPNHQTTNAPPPPQHPTKLTIPSPSSQPVGAGFKPALPTKQPPSHHHITPINQPISVPSAVPDHPVHPCELGHLEAT